MTATPFFQQSMSERRRRNVDRINDMTAKDTTISGKTLLIGPGEATFPVSFPVSFTQKPVPHFDPELDAGLSPVSQQFPGLRGCVVAWETFGAIEGVTEGYFTGATIAVTVYGDDNVRLWCHWSFRGTGLRNPIKDLELLEDTI